MKKILLKFIKNIIFIILYGSIYFVIETIYKGYLTDYRMFILGGLIAFVVGIINNAFSFDTDFLLQGFIGMMSITLLEAILGYQWNVVEQLGIWDYSNMLFNGVAGQVCLEFSIFAWIPLSFVCIILDDAIRYYICKDTEQPYYKICGKEIFRMPIRNK